MYVVKILDESGASCSTSVHSLMRRDLILMRWAGQISGCRTTLFPWSAFGDLQMVNFIKLSLIASRAMTRLEVFSATIILTYLEPRFRKDYANKFSQSSTKPE